MRWGGRRSPGRRHLQHMLGNRQRRRQPGNSIPNRLISPVRRASAAPAPRNPAPAHPSARSSVVSPHSPAATHHPSTPANTPHRRIEAVRPVRIDRVVDRVNPFHVRSEPRLPAQIDGQVHAQSTRHRHRIDQPRERRPSRQREIVPLCVVCPGTRSAGIPWVRRANSGACSPAAFTSNRQRNDIGSTPPTSISIPPRPGARLAPGCGTPSRPRHSRRRPATPA